MLRRRRDDDLHGRLRSALDGLRGILPIEDCAVELLEWRDGVATLRVAGACSHCQLDVRALAGGIEAHLRRAVPEVRAVRITD